MNVERIIMETNDETCNNPVEYDWEFDPDGVSRMTGEGDIPSGADDSTAIVEAFGHIAESIVDGERIASGGDAKWLRPLAAMLAARIPFVSGSVESGLSVDITSSEFLDCCRSVWIGADMHRGFGRYLNLRWDVGRREWVEAGSGFAFVGADSQVAFMLETAMSENDGIRFDPMEGEEDAIQLFRLLLETAKSADIPVGWDDASLNGMPVTVVYYETRDGGGNVRTYPGDSRRLAYVDARPRALMPGARLHGGNAYVEP